MNSAFVMKSADVVLMVKSFTSSLLKKDRFRTFKLLYENRISIFILYDVTVLLYGGGYNIQSLKGPIYLKKCVTFFMYV